MKVAIVGEVHQKGLEFLKENEFEVLEVSNFDDQILKNELKFVDGILLRTTKLGESVLSHCTNLKIISRHGVGYDNVDIDYLNRNKIALGITSTSNFCRYRACTGKKNGRSRHYQGLFSKS